MSDMLTLIDRIDTVTEAAELDVLTSLANSYLKEAEMIQEGFRDDVNAQIKGKPSESTLKKILMFIPRLIAKIIRMINVAIHAFSRDKSRNNKTVNTGKIDGFKSEKEAEDFLNRRLPKETSHEHSFAIPDTDWGVLHCEIIEQTDGSYAITAHVKVPCFQNNGNAMPLIWLSDIESIVKAFSESINNLSKQLHETSDSKNYRNIFESALGETTAEISTKLYYLGDNKSFVDIDLHSPAAYLDFQDEKAHSKLVFLLKEFNQIQRIYTNDVKPYMENCPPLIANRLQMFLLNMSYEFAGWEQARSFFAAPMLHLQPPAHT